jgi:ABC-2 type transport system permease protein
MNRKTISKSKIPLFPAKSKSSVSINPSPFRVLLQKEISDQVRSWRFIILISLVILTCLGSLYASLGSFAKSVKPTDAESAFFFLRLFTLSNGKLPSYVIFISFLSPLLGIGLGFDSINSEFNGGTLSRLLSQPVHRDNILNAKFLAPLIVISVMFFSLGFLVMGSGLIALGIPPTAEEFIRIILFILISIIYVAFWLNLSVFLSVKFRQPATAVLTGIAIWLLFTVFYPMIINLVTQLFEPSRYASIHYIFEFQKIKFLLMQLVPGQLFNEATTTLLMPGIRSLGPMTVWQLQGAIPSPLPLGQSILLVWPQLTGLIAVTIVCFVLSYVSFMRREVRSR